MALVTDRLNANKPRNTRAQTRKVDLRTAEQQQGSRGGHEERRTELLW
jgi:hypothetical protein